MKVVLILIFLYGCIHPSLYDAYQDARFLPVTITNINRGEVEWTFYDSKQVITEVGYIDNQTILPKDFDWKTGEYMIYYCVRHRTIYKIEKIKE